MDDFTENQITTFYAALSPEMQSSHFAAPIKTFLQVGFTEEGDSIFDFTAEDPQGNNQQLSSLTEGYLLLGIMSSGCPRCIASNEGLKALQAAQDSIQIATYYTDESKEIWLKVNEKHAGNWVSLWDGTGLEGEVYIRSGAAGFPTFLYIDPKGKVLKKWTGYSVKGDSQYIIKQIQEYQSK